MARYDHLEYGCACGLYHQNECDCGKSPRVWTTLKKPTYDKEMLYENKTKTSILLASGNYFDFLNPEGSDFLIEDIAQGLSNTCRFGGQCNKYYSVAEHSVHVSYLVPKKFAFVALMHDASEAFMNDIPKPLKIILPDYQKIERNIEQAIALRFNYVFPFPEEIKKADIIALKTEMHNLFAFGSMSVEPEVDFMIPCWKPKKAKEMFLQRFYDLQ